MAYDSQVMPRRKEVDAWFARYDNPMRDVVQRIREIVLAADRRIDECIKWQAPTFIYQGNLASFFPKSKQHASLMFHQGAKIPGKHPLLTGTGGTSRSLKLGSVAAANQAREQLVKLVRAWCDWRDAAGKPTAKRRAKTATPVKRERPQARAKRAVKTSPPAGQQPLAKSARSSVRAGSRKRTSKR